MLGDTLTVTVGGSGGTARVCSRTADNKPGQETYIWRDATQEIVARVRHTEESLKQGQPYAMQRHNVEFTWTVFATPTTTEKVRQAYLVLRNQKDDDLVAIVDIVEALAFWLSASNIGKIAVGEA